MEIYFQISLIIYHIFGLYKGIRMFLIEVKPEDEFQVIEIKAGKEATKKLLDMGFVKGIKGKVIRKSPFKGPIQVKILDYDLIVGYGEASKIVIKME